jgi:hypothetical protein
MHLFLHIDSNLAIKMQSMLFRQEKQWECGRRTVLGIAYLVVFGYNNLREKPGED